MRWSAARRCSSGTPRAGVVALETMVAAPAVFAGAVIYEPPIRILGGARSPAHLGARLDALASCLPQAERIVVKRVGHDGNLKSPADIARVVGDLADTVLPSV
jgi:hypothetical protein